MYKYDIEEPTPEQIRLLIKEHKEKYVPRYKKLQEYYGSEHEILKREFTDASKPNNKLVNSYPKYIVTVLQGFFMGKAVKYTSENADFINDLQDIFDYNDEHDENSEISKEMGIKGTSYEILYMDENSNIRFDMEKPENLIFVYDTSIEENPMFAIRFYEYQDLGESEIKTNIEVYTKTKISKYEMQKDKVVLLSEEQHSWGDVPIIEYANNDDRIGDFEPVLTLIDAYDKAQSDTSNDIDYFADAYLVLEGMPETKKEDIQEAKQERALILPDTVTGTSKPRAYWLIKDANDAVIENFKKRLQNDIHKFSQTPDLTDMNFSSNASGVAIQYKLWGLEEVAATKERKFKRGLQRRIELISNMLKIKGQKEYNYLDIAIAFTRNMPMDLSSIIDWVVKLRGIISDHKLLAQLPFIEDVDKELETIKKENEEKVDLGQLLEGEETQQKTSERKDADVS